MNSGDDNRVKSTHDRVLFPRTIDVALVHVQAELLGAAQELCREGLIDLHKVHVGQLEVGSLQPEGGDHETEEVLTWGRLGY